MESEQVTFTTQAEAGDVIWSSAAVARSSIFAVAFGTLAILAGVAAAVMADYWLALPMVLFGISIVTGLFAAPFAWMTVRNSRDIQLASTEVRADAHGVSFRSPTTSASSDWSTYRRATETGRAFLLDSGTGQVFVVPKRGVADADLSAFRSLLRSAGLLHRATARVWLLGFLIGIGLTIAIVAGTIGVNLLRTNARIGLDVSVVQDTATVFGTTDLPDGSLVSVQVYQADEWRRASIDGESPDVETFPWISGDDVTVHNGAFLATIDISGWPGGNGGAIAMFWIDPAQPAAVRDRFGANGEKLEGPGVDEFEDGTPRLRVHASFEIP